MRKVCSRVSHFSSQILGKPALLLNLILLAVFGMVSPSGRAQSVTNTLGFARATDYAMEAEGIAYLMVVRKEGARGMVQAEVQLQPDAGTNSVTGWTSNVVVTLRDNQLSALVPVTIKDNTATNSTATNTIKFKLINPRVAPGEDPSLTPIISTAFANETLTLVNDDQATTFTFSRMNYASTEGKDVIVRVRLPASPKSVGATGVSVRYTIGEINVTDCGPGASVATADTDFPTDSQVLDFGDDDTFKDITISLPTDSEIEFPEEFIVTLSEPKGSASDPAASISYNVQNPAWCRVRINNDAAATNAPVAAGSVDRTFNPESVPPSRLRNPGANGPVASVVVDDNNNTYLAGAFSSVNANPRGGIARLNEWGQIDDTFKPSGANGAVNAVQLYSAGANAGKVVIGGSFNAVNGQQYNSVARLNADGTIDSSFQIGQGADDAVYTLAVEADGNLLIGGAFENVNGIARGGIARLLPSGQVDTASFQAVDVDGPVFSVAVEALNVPSIIFSQSLTNTTAEASQTRTLAAKNGFIDIVYVTYNEPDRIQILAGGQVVYDQVVDAGFTLSTDPNGQVITNWTIGSIHVDLGPYANASTPIKVVANPGGSAGTDLDYVARITATGTAGVIIGGDFQHVNGIPAAGVARFTSSGVLDTTFAANIGSGADRSVNSVAVQSDGSIIVGGSFLRFNNVVRGGVTRLNPSGTQDLSFGSGIGSDQAVHSVFVDPSDDTIYVAGEFTMFNGTPRNFLARLNPDGTLDTTFMDQAFNQFAGFPNTTGLAIDGPMGYLATVAVAPTGDVVVGGLFAQVGGGSTRTEVHPRQNIARLVGGSTRGPGNLEISDAEIPWDENGGPAPISFTRVNGDLGAARGFITTFDGAAIGGQDYTPANAIYTLPTGKDPTTGAVTGAPYNIPIIDDSIIEGNEDFFVDLIGVDGVINLGGEIIHPGVAFGNISEAQVTIIENDTPQVLISFAKPEYDVDEDDGTAKVELYRTGDPNRLVAVDVQVRPDTGPFAATPGADFRTATNTVTFQPGQTNAFVNVAILDDAFVENDETVSLRLARPVFGAVLDTNQMTATLNIIDNDLASGRVDFSASTYKVVEGQPYVDVQVRRIGGNVGLISVDYTTVDGTAVAGQDYVTQSGRLTWNNQDISTKTIRVPIIDNGIVESDEQFTLQLSNPSTPGIIGNLHANPAVTITDNDFYGQLSFNVADFFADENGTNAVILVIRRNGSADTVSVDYSTTQGTAVPGTDYNNASGTLTFAPGETAKSFVVPIIDDNVADSNRTVNLILANPVKATLGAQKNATLTILDNESLNIPAGDVVKDFAIGSGANGRVNALWLQNDGPTNSLRKIILAGEFSDYDHTPREHVARVDDNGNIDARYANGLLIDGSVKTILGTPDGKLVIGGDFFNVDDVPSSHIARLNAVGRRDTLFDIGSGTDGSVNALAQTFVGTNRSSRIVVAGAFTVFNGVPRARIALVGEDGKIDPTFDPGVGPDFAITAVAAQRDGKLVIGGFFNKISGIAHRGIARLNLDGSVDDTFDPTLTVAGTIRAIAIQPDDKILIGGEFSSVDGVGRAGIARLNLDGTLDTTFDPAGGANGPVYSIALQPDGAIIAAGDFTTFNGVGRPRVTRLLPSGVQDLDINFGTGANAAINAALVQYNRDIVIGGDFTEVNGFPRNRFARLFGGSVVGAGRIEFFQSEYQVAESTPQVQLVVKRSGGTETEATVDYFTQPETASAGSDYRDVSGTLTFGPGESAKTITVPILDDNISEPIETVLVTLTNVVGASIGRQPIARVEIVSDDTVISFARTDYIANEGIVGGLATISIIREGNLSFPVNVTVSTSDGTATSPADYVSATTQLTFTPGESTKNVTIRIVDDNLGEGNETVNLHLSVSGASALPGLADSVLIIEDNDSHAGILTFNSSETLVNENDGTATFQVSRTSGSQGSATVRIDTVAGTATEGVDYIGFHGTLSFGDGQTTNSVTVQIIDDKAIEATETFTLQMSNITGAAPGANTSLKVGIADDEFGPGSLDTTFDPGAGTDAAIYSLALQPDGKIAIGGQFTKVDNVSANHVARLLADGSPDPDFSIGQGPDNTVYAVELGEQGSIWVGGAFRTFDSTDWLYLTRVTTNGFLDTSMAAQPGLNSTVLDLTRQSDTKVLIGGQFVIPSPHIGRVNASGQFDVSFNTQTSANDDVLDARPANDGKVVIGGKFSVVGGLSRGHIARLQADGRLDTSFDTTVGANGIVRAVYPLADGRVLIGGDFTQVNGESAPYLALLKNDGSVDTTFASTNALNGPVYAIDVYPNGKIVAAGNFTAAGTQTRKGLVRLDSAGTLDPEFEVPVEVDGTVYRLKIQPDGKILLVGSFSHVNGYPRNNIARVNGLKVAPPLVITTTSFDGSDLVLTFATEAGSSYEVQYTTDFTTWTNARTVNASGDTAQVNLPTNGGNYQFFRIVKVP